ncbi:MAG: DMT family transporter [Pseudomonadota bacterium]
MELWVWLAVAAAFVQTLRFMVQKHLASVGLGAVGATLARFLYAAPLAVLGLALYSGGVLPSLQPAFWINAFAGGAAQILATICVVAVFAHRNFAVGITLKKTEVILTALAGFLVLGDRISGPGAAALAIGFLAVLLLSDPPEGQGRFWARILNRAAGLGILSGVFFAVSAVAYRGATLEVLSDDPVLRAGLTLAVVSVGQTLGLSLWMAVRTPADLVRVFAAWRIAAFAGALSVVASFFWFWAFTLERAAYVFAVGQIELVLSLAAATLFFRERVMPRELLGIAGLTLSILGVVIWG